MTELQTRPLLVTAVETVGQQERVRSVYLHMVRRPDGSEEPILLGTGRNAVVFLATDVMYLDSRAEYRAVKFLRDDPDDQLAYSAAMRFFQEALSLANRSGNIDSLVRFLGWGAIARDLARRGPVSSIKEFWWGQYFDDSTSVDFANNDGADYQRIKDRYGLQGPFYCLELCHGTLEHLLEGSNRWSDLPIYHYNALDGWTLRENAREAQADLHTFVQRYLQEGAGAPLDVAAVSRMSGYDLLNAFRTAPVPISDDAGRPLRDTQGPIVHDPNTIRNHVILKLFSRIVQSIQYLHRAGEAHRDLKPGNIFFRHSNTVPLTTVDVKLADLGYVTNTDVIRDGETFKAGGDQAPGSPFFRAPEQADLPIEVRITVDPDHPDRVMGKGSKISNIGPSDWLFVADLFEDYENFHVAPAGDEDTDQRKHRAQLTLDRRNAYRDHRYYRIREAAVDERAGTFALQLEGSLAGHVHYDLQAHVSKSTGFHTDVYSLGALLYDLASGGRNPEHFFTYCLKVFTDQFGVNNDRIPGSIDEVLDILAPADHGRPRELQNRARLAWMVMTTKNVDGLIEEILRSAYVEGTTSDVQRTIRDYRFRTFDVVNTLLTDKRGVPIPREIVRIIVRCMLRDKRGSFCRSDMSWGATLDGQRLIVKEIEKELDELLGGKFGLPEYHFPDPLRDNLLFRLRALSYLPGASEAERPMGGIASVLDGLSHSPPSEIGRPEGADATLEAPAKVSVPAEEHRASVAQSPSNAQPADKAVASAAPLVEEYELGSANEEDVDFTQL